jgi:class 3 adenylate cyclase
MTGRRYEATMSRRFEAPRAIVWALVADTNRWDRAAGLKPATYGWRIVDGVRARYAVASELGLRLEWTEAPYHWLEGWFVRGERRFLKGPVATGGFEAQLEDDGDGTRVVVRAYTTAERPWHHAIALVTQLRFGGALRRFLDAIDGALSSDGASNPDVPAVVRARRLMMQHTDVVTNGPRTEPDHALLLRRAERLTTDVDPRAREQLVRLLAERPDEEVAQIRPFELAEVWGVDRVEVLRAFLQATHAGLVDLRWQINCPVCRVSAAVRSSLDEVGHEVHCEACDIDYRVDFARHIEAVFASNPAVREVGASVYCASSPAFLPHVYAQLRVGPGEMVEERAELPRELHLRVLGSRATADAIVNEQDQLEVSFDGETLEAHPSAAPRGLLTFDNRSRTAATLLVERAGWTADMVLGSTIATLPEFLNLFATEAPASGVELSVGELVVLFSDLTGSTALYQSVGDARAFAIVEKHFKIMTNATRKHDGTVIKTMGDAVMAAFTRPRQAVEAAIEMVWAHEDEELGRGHELGVKLGIHSGPCLAVRANERLDFFGTTVNMAARLQGRAAAGHVVLTEELARDPEVSAVLADYEQHTFESDLKGIRATQRLVSVRLDGPRKRANAKLA